MEMFLRFGIRRVIVHEGGATLMKQQSGFTLVELAVVVFLIGLIATMGLTALKAQLDSAAISNTKKKQDTIKDALIAYLGKYKRLPCPAIDNSGQESRVITNAPANCTGYFGIVPYATLGLQKSAALDGWENFFSYAVSPQWTLTYSSATPVAGGTTSNVASNAFNVGDAGALSINDRSPATSSITTSVTSNAVALIVSHGKNGLGAFTSKGTQNVSPASGKDEFKNVPISTWVLPAAFFQREYTDIDVPTYGAFDDVVTWLSSNDLISPLTKDGSLKSAEAQWADQVTQINNALASSMFVPGTYCPPPSNQPAFNALLIANNILLVDPWGGTLTYSRLITRMRPDGTVSPGGTSYPYSITTATAGKTIMIPSNVTLYATYQSIIQNYCN